MFEPKRLHPIAIVLNITKRIKNTLFPLFAIVFLGRGGNGGIWISIISASAVLLFLLIGSILSWFKHTYQLDEKELRIENGIFICKKRYIPFERIQSIDVTEGVLQRIYGLVKVQIETAGGNPLEESEAVLSAITKKDAQFIQDFFIMAKKSGHLTVEPVPKNSESIPIYKITAFQLLLLSITSGGVGVVISGIIATLSQFDNFIPYQKLFGNAEKLATNRILFVVIMVFIGFLVLWVIAFLGMMLKYANFTVNKTDHDLIITQGLLEKRQMTFPLKRIQVVRISENVFRQLLGYATVYIESAGGSVEYKEGSRVMLIPIIKHNQISQIVSPYLTDYKLVSYFNPVPKKAMLRYMLRGWYWTVPIVIASLLFFKVWGFFSLILFAAVTLWTFLKYRDSGWNLENLQLSFRYRTLSRSTIYMKKNRIQSLDVRESYFQRRNQLATIEAFVKSGLGGAGGKVKDLAVGEVEEIYSWYSNK
ncbi:PH domain-containing protein [Bacillus sp. EB600]|uniref:PH domain-containing protein n=1 Tax=Bacillus sp. EB600 TaxID=2806345 RepID=UPI00210B39AA|nr:PH domain-containing protein [Bacillus sp. EB600]MCQ6282246.1 PH domain-containing protein [Bacillus sp. EB600]